MRVVRKVNIRVEVAPRTEGDWGWVRMTGIGTPESNEAHELTEAHRILQEITRHVDSIAGAAVRYETETWCNDPKYGGVESGGNTLGRWPACCDADQREFYAEHAHESDEWFAAHGMDDPEFLQEFRQGFHTATETEGHHD